VNVWIIEILFCWLLIILSTESDQPLFVEIAYEGLDWWY